MCFHKSVVAEYNKLMAHYEAAFDSILEDLKLEKERFSVLMSHNEKERPYTAEEIKEMKWLQKLVNSFTETHFQRYHENGFDYLPSPIITTGSPEAFKFFRWGLVPWQMKNYKEAMDLRVRTLNCISEEMYDKPSFRDAAKNGQRCLIPVTGFYEWRWLDEKGKVKIPYYVSFKNQEIMSIAGLYSRWKDKATEKYYYSYTVLTTTANPLMEYVHNNKKRMPVFIPKEYEKDWLNKNLSKDDVLALCQPFNADEMKANTVSKLITTKEAETNVEDVLKLHRYEQVSTDEVVSEL